MYNVKKFDEHGTVRNRQSEASGARKTVRTRANIAAVRQALRRDPNSSCRRNAVPNIPRSSFNRIVPFFKGMRVVFHRFYIIACHAKTNKGSVLKLTE